MGIIGFAAIDSAAMSAADERAAEAFDARFEAKSSVYAMRA